MTISSKRAESVLAAVDQMVKDGRTRIGMEQMHQLMRRYGILESYQRKEVMLYLQANERIKLEGNMIKFLRPFEKDIDETEDRS